MASSRGAVRAVVLLSFTLLAGCDRSNNADVAQAKADAVAARAELAKVAAEADSLRAELARLKFAKEELVTVRAELAKLKAAKAAPVKAPADDQDRKAAEWVVRVGGIVRVNADGVQSEHPRDGKLPEGPVKVTFVNLLESGSKSKLTNDGVKYLAGLKHLKSLEMHPVGVNDFSFLKDLQSLETFHARFTDAGLVQLKNLTGIKHLAVGYFHGNPDVTDAGLASIKELKNLEDLDLSGCPITDAGLEYLRDLKKLKWLSLFRTRVSDVGLQHLKGLSDLRELHLSQTQVTGPGLEHLKGLPKLAMLNIGGNRIADAAVAHLKELSNLRQLNLQGTMVTDNGIKSLKAALPNCNIMATVKK